MQKAQAERELMALVLVKGVDGRSAYATLSTESRTERRQECSRRCIGICTPCLIELFGNGKRSIFAEFDMTIPSSWRILVGMRGVGRFWLQRAFGWRIWMETHASFRRSRILKAIWMEGQNGLMDWKNILEVIEEEMIKWWVGDTVSAKPRSQVSGLY